MNSLEATTLVFRHFLFDEHLSDPTDSIFRCMVKKHRKCIMDHYAAIFDWAFENEKTCVGTIQFEFHKSFRQTDVLDDGYNDMIVWNALSGCPTFWKYHRRVLSRVMDGTTYEDYIDDEFYGDTRDITQFDPKPKPTELATLTLTEDGHVELWWSNSPKFTEFKNEKFAKMSLMERVESMLTRGKQLYDKRIKLIEKIKNDRLSIVALPKDFE